MAHVIDNDAHPDPFDGPAAPTRDTDPGAQRAARIEALVTEWRSVPELAERQGVRLSQARRQLKDAELVGVRRGPNAAVYVPAVFLGDDGPDPRLKGTFTVLRDGGMGDDEIIEWLFTPDDTLPVNGAPMDALLAGFVTEVRRRAMEEAM